VLKRARELPEEKRRELKIDSSVLKRLEATRRPFSRGKDQMICLRRNAERGGDRAGFFDGALSVWGGRGAIFRLKTQGYALIVLIRGAGGVYN